MTQTQALCLTKVAILKDQPSDKETAVRRRNRAEQYLTVDVTLTSLSRLGTSRSEDEVETAVREWLRNGREISTAAGFLN
jgi:hypothetical protein